MVLPLSSLVPTPADNAAISQLQSDLQALSTQVANDISALQTSLTNQFTGDLAMLGTNLTQQIATLGNQHADDFTVLQAAIDDLQPQEGKDWGATPPPVGQRYPGQQWYSSVDEELYYWNPTVSEFLAPRAFNVSENSDNDRLMIEDVSITSPGNTGIVFPYLMRVRRFYMRIRGNESGAARLFLNGATLYDLDFSSQDFADSGLISNVSIPAGGLLSATIDSNSGNWNKIVGRIELARVYTP